MATKPISEFLTALKVMKPVGLIDYEPGNPDAPLLAMWNHRCRLLAEIESHCRFYDAGIDTKIKKQDHEFSVIESAMHKMPALTAQGLMAKLWLAFEHCGPYCSTEEIREQGDAIRRGDFAEVETFADALDFDQSTLFYAIRDIRHWLKFEQVYLPQRAA